MRVRSLYQAEARLAIVHGARTSIEAWSGAAHMTSTRTARGISIVAVGLGLLVGRDAQRTTERSIASRSAERSVPDDGSGHHRRDAHAERNCTA